MRSIALLTILILIVGIGSVCAEQWERVTASKTLAESELNKSFVATGSGITITLMPSSGSGQIVRFAVADANQLNIDPNNTDQIMYLTCAGGDRIQSPSGASSTGACVELVDFVSGKWGVTSMNGTWTDNN